MDIVTPFGVLRSAVEVRSFEDGKPEWVRPGAESSLQFPFGTLVPLYSVEDLGRRKEAPVLFHPSGQPRSIPLQSRVLLPTSAGRIPAELVTFYPSGEVRRIFPSAGKLTGYWNEENEYAEAPICELRVGFHVICAKFIHVQFYPDGNVESVVLWPEERVTLDTPVGKILVRKGVEFYPDGTLASVESADPVPLETPIGQILAFEPNPLGVSAADNTLRFHPDGSLAALATPSTHVEVVDAEGTVYKFAPSTVQSYCESAETKVKTLSVRFQDAQVLLDGMAFPLESTFSTQQTRFAFRSCSCH